MPKLDDGWNLVKLHEGRNSGVGEEDDDPMTSKSQLSIDIVSDDFNVDDDILSNTSSDDYTELSNSLRPRKTGGGRRYVEDSFDTLTGSVASQTSQPERSAGKIKSCGLSKFMIKTFMPSRGSRSESGIRNIWSAAEFWKASFKLWHIILLSSLVSMFVFIGAQMYSPSIFSGIVKHGAKVAQTPSINDKNELIYGDINFLNHGETDVLSTWKPTGKYYVDFDNHIAYPINQNDLIGLQRYKTDMIIFWYTARAKVTTFWKADVIPSARRFYQKLSASIGRDAQWLQIYFHKLQGASYNTWKVCISKLEHVGESTIENAKRGSLTLSKKLRANFKRGYKLLQQAGHQSRLALRKCLNHKFIKQRGITINKKYQRLLLKCKSDIGVLTSSFRKASVAMTSKYNKNIAPQCKKWLTRSSKAPKKLYKRALPMFENEFAALRRFFSFKANKGIYQHLKENFSEEKPKFKHFWDQSQKELSFYRAFVRKSTSDLKNLTTHIWKSHVTS